MKADSKELTEIIETNSTERIALQQSLILSDQPHYYGQICGEGIENASICCGLEASGLDQSESLAQLDGVFVLELYDVSIDEAEVLEDYSQRVEDAV